MFPVNVAATHGSRRNELVIDFEDPGSITASFLTKEPGPRMQLAEAEMAFRYTDSLAAANNLEGYERLILDAMLGDQALFTRSDGIERLWEISMPLLDNPPPVQPYARGHGALTRSSSSSRRSSGDSRNEVLVMKLGYDKPLYLMAFDHRGSFEKGLFGSTPPISAEVHAGIVDAKQIIYEGFLARGRSGRAGRRRGRPRRRGVRSRCCSRGNGGRVRVRRCPSNDQAKRSSTSSTATTSARTSRRSTRRSPRSSFATTRRETRR